MIRAAAAAVVILASASASAAPTDEADALFEEGRTLMERGELPLACAKLERSFQLAPRLGAMLNLGACLEKRGQLSRALAIFERAVTLARELGRPDRETAAREYAAALEGRVAKLLVVLDHAQPDLVIQIDGETLSTRSGLVPVDPGPRHLVASAPGFRPFEVTLDLTAGQTTTVKVPPLPPARSTSPPTAREAPSQPSRSARPWIVIAGAGISAVGVGVGSYFGLRARSKWDDSSADCDASGCGPDGLRLIDEAKSAGNVATASFIVAGVAVAVTIAALVWPSGSKTTSRASSVTRLAPSF